MFLDTDALFSGFRMLLALDIFIYIFLGLIVGIIAGAIPGISVTSSLAIMIIPSYFMKPLNAILFLSAIYTGAIHGGGLTAILLNMPGTPTAVATTFDGYAMTKKGQYSEAMGIAVSVSAVGCFVGYFIILIAWRR